MIARSARSRPHTRDGKVYVRRFPARSSGNLHLLVIISFLGLALTGMTLKFSYRPWAAVLSRWLGGFEAAGSSTASAR